MITGYLIPHLIDQCTEFEELTGEAGDCVIMVRCEGQFEGQFEGHLKRIVRCFVSYPHAVNLELTLTC